MEAHFVWVWGAQTYVIYNIYAPIQTSGRTFRLSSTCSNICNLQYIRTDEDFWKHISFELDELKHMWITIQTHRWRLLQPRFVWARNAQTYVIYNTNTPMETSGSTVSFSSMCSKICNLQYKRSGEGFGGKNMFGEMGGLDVLKHMQFTIQTHRYRLREEDVVWVRRAQTNVLRNT